MWRAVALTLLVYVSLDFGDPGMPGALLFDPDQSVDAVRSPLNATAAVARGAAAGGPLLPGAASWTTAASSARARLAPVVVRTPPTDVRPRALLTTDRVPAASDDH